MNAQQLYEAGRLDEAVAAQLAEVKAHPADLGRRTFYFELLAFQGDLDRAARQLEVMAQQDIERDATAQIYRNVLEAERHRRRLFAEGLKPHFLLDPPADIECHLQAVNRLRDGDVSAARELLDQADEARAELTGILDGAAFEGFRDCDDLLAPVLELFIGRDYVWLPFSQLQSFEVLPPTTPRDLLWAGCQITLADGLLRRAFLPVLYCGSHVHADDAVRLGRMTDWHTTDGGPVRGVGQRLFLAGETDRACLEVRRVEFGVAAA